MNLQLLQAPALLGIKAFIWALQQKTKTKKPKKQLLKEETYNMGRNTNVAWIFVDGKVLFLIMIIILQLLLNILYILWVQAEIFAEK